MEVPHKVRKQTCQDSNPVTVRVKQLFYPLHYTAGCGLTLVIWVQTQVYMLTGVHEGIAESKSAESNSAAGPFPRSLNSR